MFEHISRTVHSYLWFYQHILLQQWRNMTPVSYGCLLIGIGVVGFLLMKSGQTK